MSIPPLSVGSLQDNEAPDATGTAVIDAGAAGGAIGDEVAHVLTAPEPAAFVACTRKTYATPFVRPVTVPLNVTPSTESADVQLRPPFADFSTT